jgi:hypothetical protein
LQASGTVATNGVCVFASPIASNTMAAGAYDSFVRIQDGATLVTASRSTLYVYKSPYPDSPSVVPFSFAEPLWVGASNRVVYSNQMGSGATWTGSNWTFAASGTSENFATNAAFLSVSNSASLGVTNATGGILSLIGRQISLVASNITAALDSVYAAIVHSHTYTAVTNAPWLTAEADTNALAQLHSITGRVAMALTNEADTLTSVAARGGFAGTETISPDSISISQPDPFIPFTITGPGSATKLYIGLDTGASYVPALVSESNSVPTFWRFRNFGDTNLNVASTADLAGYVPTTGVTSIIYSNAADFARADLALTNLTAAGIAAAGGVTNRTYVTATLLDCSPTTTITRAMIDAAPWGEMSLSLTGACYLTFDATVTGTVDVATFALYLSGTNALTWNTNQLTGTAWTNATATGSDRIFRKAARAGTVAIW